MREENIRKMTMDYKMIIEMKYVNTKYEYLKKYS